jgi:hypothetical protein
MKRVLTVASVIAVLIATGCTSGDTDAGDDTAPAADSTTAAETTSATTAAATDTSAPSETEATEPATTVSDGPPAGLDGPAPGVTDTSIKLGITYIDLGSTAVATSHGDYEGTYRAVIDDLNARGGINGRTIEPVFAPISLAEGGNADAVCVQLTEDEDVFAVVGFFLGDAPACYLETHQTAIVGGTMTDELLDRAQAPWYSWDPSSDFDRDALAKLAESGDLDGTLGVFGTAANQATLDSVILPTLDELGIAVSEVAINDAPTDDQVLSDAQNAAILQRFEAAGIDNILGWNNDVVPVLTALETSSYRPEVVGTNYGAANVFIEDPERDHSVLEGFVSTGIYGPQAAQYSEPDYLACAEIVKAAGVEYIPFEEWQDGQPKPFVSAWIACVSLSLFEAIATKAGPDLNYATYEWAGDNLGELKLPGNPEPYFFGPRPHSDGDAPVFVYDYDSATGGYVRRD